MSKASHSRHTPFSTSVFVFLTIALQDLAHRTQISALFISMSHNSSIWPSFYGRNRAFVVGSTWRQAHWETCRFSWIPSAVWTAIDDYTLQVYFKFRERPKKPNISRPAWAPGTPWSECACPFLAAKVEALRLGCDFECSDGLTRSRDCQWQCQPQEDLRGSVLAYNETNDF